MGALVRDDCWAKRASGDWVGAGAGTEAGASMICFGAVELRRGDGLLYLGVNGDRRQPIVVVYGDLTDLIERACLWLRGVCGLGIDFLMIILQ